MKKTFLVLSSITLLFTACTSISAVSKGIENQSYLKFIETNKDYEELLKVSIDENKPFEAKSYKGKEKTSQKIYAIPTGKHRVIVKTINGDLVYDKIIFIGNQETKKILLP